MASNPDKTNANDLLRSYNGAASLGSLWLNIAGANKPYQATVAGHNTVPVPVVRVREERELDPLEGTGAPPSPKKRRKRVLTDEKRKERNAKEQARSNQLSQQFEDLRSVLTKAGIVVPKGTKVCVLTLAMDYIKVLEQSKDTVDGATSTVMDTLNSVTRNSVSKVDQVEETLENICAGSVIEQDATSASETSYYKLAFEHCQIAMALATLGGSIVHGNSSFWELTKSEGMDEMSIFSLAARGDLPAAFERLNAILHSDATVSKTIELRSCYPGLDLRITKLSSGDGRGNGTSEVDEEHRLLVLLVPKNTT